MTDIECNTCAVLAELQPAHLLVLGATRSGKADPAWALIAEQSKGGENDD